MIFFAITIASLSITIGLACIADRLKEISNKLDKN